MGLNSSSETPLRTSPCASQTQSPPRCLQSFLRSKAHAASLGAEGDRNPRLPPWSGRLCRGVASEDRRPLSSLTLVSMRMVSFAFRCLASVRMPAFLTSSEGLPSEVKRTSKLLTTPFQWAASGSDDVFEQGYETDARFPDMHAHFGRSLTHALVLLPMTYMPLQPSSQPLLMPSSLQQMPVCPPSATFFVSTPFALRLSQISKDYTCTPRPTNSFSGAAPCRPTPQRTALHPNPHRHPPKATNLSTTTIGRRSSFQPTTTSLRN